MTNFKYQTNAKLQISNDFSNALPLDLDLHLNFACLR